MRDLGTIRNQQETLRAGLQTLDSQVRTIGRTLKQADVNPDRWGEPAVRAALQRALQIMVRRIEVVKHQTQKYTVRIWLPDAENLLFSDSVINESAYFL